MTNVVCYSVLRCLGQLFRDLLKMNGSSISGRYLDQVKSAVSWLVCTLWVSVHVVSQLVRCCIG